MIKKSQSKPNLRKKQYFILICHKSLKSVPKMVLVILALKQKWMRYRSDLKLIIIHF
jgi:hypothetical protein